MASSFFIILEFFENVMFNGRDGWREGALTIQNKYMLPFRIKNQNNTVSNFSLNGSIDFKNFFEPRYSLNATGKDIFFRSLNND